VRPWVFRDGPYRSENVGHVASERGVGPGCGPQRFRDSAHRSAVRRRAVADVIGVHQGQDRPFAVEYDYRLVPGHGLTRMARDAYLIAADTGHIGSLAPIRTTSYGSVRQYACQSGPLVGLRRNASPRSGSVISSQLSTVANCGSGRACGC
jgi:hypothetical protein